MLLLKKVKYKKLQEKVFKNTYNFFFTKVML